MNPSITYWNRSLQRLAAVGILLLGMLAIGCQRTASESGAVGPMPSAQSHSAISPSTDQGGNTMLDWQGAIRKDMAYVDLRKLLLGSGWEPVEDPRCQVQVIGDDQKTCAANPDLALCKVCEQMPELSAYSGDGFATSRFRDGRTGKTLTVISYGMIEDWNVPGEDSRLRVEEWESVGTQE